MTASVRSRLNLEPLDRRDVPATITPPSGGVLTIDGTSARDHVSVSYWLFNQIRVTVATDPPASGPVASVSYYFPTAAVQQIDFFGYAGDDKFTNNTSIKCVADGGWGNDTITGGGGNDTLVGGPDITTFLPDNDVIRGGGGNDTLYGGGWADLMDGEGGNDWLYGGVGNDTMYGGAGSDRVYGEAGNDRLRGDDGTSPFGDHAADSLYGGLGNDTLVVPACESSLYVDMLFYNPFDDTIEYDGCIE